MGANTFMVYAKGATAQRAFDEAVKSAQHEHGNGGYTGTIAEKDCLVMIPFQSLQEPALKRKAARRFAHDLLVIDERVSDKWGPAGCIDLGGGEFLFFGWASS